MRQMDRLVAALMAIFSVYLMWKSTELPVGWIKGYGPGGGAYPFWLSVLMLLTSGAILVRTLRGLTPESRTDAPFFVDAGARRQIFVVVGALTAMIAVTSGIYIFGFPLLPALGVYVAVPLFMIFYMRYLGRHRWVTVLLVSFMTPVVTFLFFEKLLLILLPKGITDELFYIFF